VALSVKDRVFAAAEQISPERRPTVSTARAAAGVSNADATRYLKEWAEEKNAAGGQVAATPAAVLEQAARLAGTCWAEASTLADQRHAAAEAVWAQEKKDLGLEISELVADLDKVSAEKDAAVTELTARITALDTQANRQTRPSRNPSSTLTPSKPPGGSPHASTSSWPTRQNRRNRRRPNPHPRPTPGWNRCNDCKERHSRSSRRRPPRPRGHSKGRQNGGASRNPNTGVEPQHETTGRRRLYRDEMPRPVHRSLPCS
jgi:F0F1-type ATP synthase membrane subunit b/b'